MSCQHQLAWYELIPLFSYVGLLGRCRSCKTKISIQYPLVELAVGIILAALFLKFQDLFFFPAYAFAITYAYYAVCFSLLVVIAVYDLKHKIIPDILSLVLGVVSFLGLFLFDNVSNLGFFVPYLHLPSLIQFLSGPLIAAPFVLLWLVSKGRWMGLGDAKLAISLGWIAGLYTAISGVVLAFWIGAVVGISLLVFSGKYKMKSEIPFAPYLVLGTLLAFVFDLHIFF